MIVVVALIVILGWRQGLNLVILLLKEVVTIIDLAAEELIKEIASSFTYFLAYRALQLLDKFQATLLIKEQLGLSQ